MENSSLSKAVLMVLVMGDGKAWAGMIRLQSMGRKTKWWVFGYAVICNLFVAVMVRCNVRVYG